MVVSTKDFSKNFCAESHNSEESNADRIPNYVPFSTGRTQICSGVVHLLRDLSAPPLAEQLSEIVTVYRKPAVIEGGEEAVGAVYRFPQLSVVLILAIPSFLSPAEFIRFIGTEQLERVERMRLLRDAAPNRYMAILKFNSGLAALDFINQRDERLFSPSEPELCHAVLVSSVEYTTTAPILEPLFDDADFVDAVGDTPALGQLVGNFIEIPTCPVCLERIDSSVTGVMIVVCQHKFHCRCLERWGDGACPVCRFSLKSKDSSLCHKSGRAGCSQCNATTNIWLCLICGHAGCGRYEEGHANGHFCATGHNFALEISTHRVWDYLGDKYIINFIWRIANR